VTPDESGSAVPLDTVLLDALPMAAVLLDGRATIVHANPAARSLFERADTALAGGSALDLLFGEHRGPAVDVLRHARGSGRWEGELRVIGREETPREALVSCVSLPDPHGGSDSGEPWTLMVVEESGGTRNRARRLAERLTRLASVTSELLLADSIEDVTRIVIEHMADAAGATVASLSVPIDDHTLRLVGLRGGLEGASRRWQTFRMAGTPAGDCMLGREPLVLSGRDAIQSRYPGLESAAEGERSIVCLPLLVGDHAIGVATMSFPGRRSFDGAELEFFRVMADACAQAIERVHAVAEAADQASKLRFLADAADELASSLDYESTLGKVADLAVPWFADWCSISLAVDGELRTLRIAHTDPAKVALVEEFQRRNPSNPDSPRGSYQVFRTGRSELIPEIDDAMLSAAGLDQEQLDMVHQLSLASAMSVPLKVKDRVLGVITWAAGEGGRRFDREDLAFGEDLARRAAVAIDNAQLHTELREMAVRLQRAVLPDALPDVAGWELAAHYSPAGHLEAGGDFYDVIDLGAGRLAFFVGDVMGRGVHAAAAMAQMRSAVRAFIAVDPHPAQMLSRLDRLFERYDLHQLVTMVYGVVDCSRDELELANAGHPAPVVIRPGAPPTALTATNELLLGAGRSHRSTAVVPFRQGDLLFVFTDGLVERRSEDIDVGERRLLAAADRLRGGDLKHSLPAVIDEVRDETRDDDVAALVLRRAPDEA